jgi:hypothetical protein
LAPCLWTTALAFVVAPASLLWMTSGLVPPVPARPLGVLAYPGFVPAGF